LRSRCRWFLVCHCPLVWRFEEFRDRLQGSAGRRPGCPRAHVWSRLPCRNLCELGMWKERKTSRKDDAHRPLIIIGALFQFTLHTMSWLEMVLLWSVPPQYHGRVIVGFVRAVRWAVQTISRPLPGLLGRIMAEIWNYDPLITH
jgi:hypothetical protein